MYSGRNSSRMSKDEETRHQQRRRDEAQRERENRAREKEIRDRAEARRQERDQSSNKKPALTLAERGRAIQLEAEALDRQRKKLDALMNENQKKLDDEEKKITEELKAPAENIQLIDEGTSDGAQQLVDNQQNEPEAAISPEAVGDGAPTSPAVKPVNIVTPNNKGGDPLGEMDGETAAAVAALLEEDEMGESESGSRPPAASSRPGKFCFLPPRQKAMFFIDWFIKKFLWGRIIFSPEYFFLPPPKFYFADRHFYQFVWQLTVNHSVK